MKRLGFRDPSPLRSQPALPPNSTWRVTTAVRTFGLAVVACQVADPHAARAVGVVLTGLCVVALVTCACELHASRVRLPWISVAEGLMVGLLIGLARSDAEFVLLYLAIPAVVAGISGGLAGTTNTWLATVLAFVTAAAANRGPGVLPHDVAPAALWLAVGFGAGLLAAHQARSLRRLEAAQAPYAAAHRLVGQLHLLVRQSPELLDVNAQAAGIRETVHENVGAQRSVILVQGAAGLEPVSASGSLTSDDEAAGRLCASYGQRLHRNDAVALPLRVGQHVVGAMVIGRATPLSVAQLDAVQQALDEHAIRLETALLVDDVRLVATTEERNRLAREIHDGVAQRVVSLGYLTDEVAAASQDPSARQRAEELRTEVTELINALRFSVFDLRQDVDDAGGLSAALSEYARELSTHSELRVHLTLDERGATLLRRTESELLRIAQEAIGNVHRHAHAINVWVRLEIIGCDFRMVIDDDGVGGAVPRDGHYGMHTMRERAERIGAHIEIGTRHDGGTTVAVRSGTAEDNTMEAQHDQRLARR